MTLSQKIAAIARAGREQGKTDEFIALAMIFFLDWDLDFSLDGNGFLDDDQGTKAALKTQLEELKLFMRSTGIVSWYNRTPG